MIKCLGLGRIYSGWSELGPQNLLFSGLVLVGARYYGVGVPKTLPCRTQMCTCIKLSISTLNSTPRKKPDDNHGLRWWGCKGWFFTVAEVINGAYQKLPNNADSNIPLNIYIREDGDTRTAGIFKQHVFHEIHWTMSQESGWKHRSIPYENACRIRVCNLPIISILYFILPSPACVIIFPNPARNYSIIVQAQFTQ